MRADSNSVVVVRAGGSGLFIKTPYTSDVPWNWYRGIQIDHEYFAQLIAAIHRASVLRRIVFVPGGVGAYLYVKLAEGLGLPDKTKNFIGSSIVNVTGEIVLNSLIARDADVAGSAIAVSSTLRDLSLQHRIVVVRATPEFRSTDSLAAMAAVTTSAAELMMFKQGVPVFHLGLRRPTRLETLSTSQLKAMLSHSKEVPGKNAIVESQALSTIIASRIRSVLYDANDVRHLDKIIQEDNWPTRTRLVLD